MRLQIGPMLPEQLAGKSRQILGHERLPEHPSENGPRLLLHGSPVRGRLSPEPLLQFIFDVADNDACHFRKIAPLGGDINDISRLGDTASVA